MTSKYQKKQKLEIKNISNDKNIMSIQPKNPNKTQFETAIDMYITDRQLNGISEGTTRAYRNALTQICDFVPVEIMETPLAQWTQSDIDTIHVGVQNAKNKKTSNDLAGKSKETYLRNFRLFVHWLVQNKYVNRDLFVKPYKAPQAKPKMYTQEEIVKLMQQPIAINRMDFTDFRNYVMVVILAETGVRRSSLVNIKIEDVDLLHNQIQIVKSKNKNVYSVRISSTVCDLLKQYLGVRMPQGSDVKESDVLFCDEYQRPITPDGLNTIMDKYLKKRGVTPKGIHAFRHSAATMMYQNGASLSEVAQQTGHKDLRQVESYVHTVSALQQDKIEKYSPIARILESV